MHAFFDVIDVFLLVALIIAGLAAVQVITVSKRLNKLLDVLDEMKVIKLGTTVHMTTDYDRFWNGETEREIEYLKSSLKRVTELQQSHLELQDLQASMKCDGPPYTYRVRRIDRKAKIVRST